MNSIISQSMPMLFLKTLLHELFSDLKEYVTIKGILLERTLNMMLLRRSEKEPCQLARLFLIYRLPPRTSATLATIVNANGSTS